MRMELGLTLRSLLYQLSFARIISRSVELMQASLCSCLLDDFKMLVVLAGGSIAPPLEVGLRDTVAVDGLEVVAHGDDVIAGRAPLLA